MGMGWIVHPGGYGNKEIQNLRLASPPQAVKGGVYGLSIDVFVFAIR